MNSSPNDRGVLRWGGLAGIGGGIAFLGVFAIVAVFVGTDLFNPEGLLQRFPDIRAARTVENGLYVGVLILWILHFLALYRALRLTSHAPALFGSTLGIVGLTILAAGALPHVVSVPISDLYHAAGAADKAALVGLWQVTQAIFDGLLITGLCITPFALLALGVAMVRTPNFGAVVGWMSVLLGLAGVAAAVVLLIDPGSSIAAASIFGLILFHIVAGWKVLRRA